MKELPVLSHPVEIAKIGAGETVVTIAATQSDRAELAAQLGLVEIAALSAEVSSKREKGVILVEGRVKAEIVQNCVVSLEPVPQTIDEPISRRFVEEGSRLAPTPPNAGSEVRVDPTAEEPPEVLTAPTLDVGAVVVEHFVLAIDPYPRAPGAALPDNPAEDAGGPGDSPFAALAKIRGAGSKGD